MAFEDMLDIAVTRKNKDGATCRVELKPGYLNSQGVIHGGIIASIADEVAWHAIVQMLGERKPMTTSELKVNYLRPLEGKYAKARGFVLRLGRTLAVTRVDILDSHRHLVAHATVTYAFLSR